MMRVAAGDEEPRERLGNADRCRLGSVAIEMAQCRAHAAAVVNCPRELHSSSPRLVCCVLDAPTVLLGGFAPRPPSEKTPEGRRVSRVAEEERLERVKGQSNVRVCCRA